jgi:hypothetical protein
MALPGLEARFPPSPTENVASLLMLNRFLSYDVNPAILEDEFWKRDGTHEAAKALACEGSALKL